MSDCDALREAPVNDCSCGHAGKPAHPCPFKEDVRNDSTTLCTCCDACRKECLYDI